MNNKNINKNGAIDPNELKDMLGLERLGGLSDGYHTFDDLYHHRAALFSVICCQNNDISWKSRKHSDGTMFDGMFIVGIETPEGQATYHYNNQYWDMFDGVPELPYAPDYDGHDSNDAIYRILDIRYKIFTHMEEKETMTILGDSEAIMLAIICKDNLSNAWKSTNSAAGYSTNEYAYVGVTVGSENFVFLVKYCHYVKLFKDVHEIARSKVGLKDISYEGNIKVMMSMFDSKK